MNDQYIRISTNSLLVHYGNVTALDIEELDIQGNIICLIGHNGSGKSTFMKTILDLHLPTRGSIKIHKLNTGQQLSPSQHMVFSPEQGSVFSDISVEQYIKFWCRLKLHNSQYYLKEGSKYLEQLQVIDYLPKLGRELSKGERRRVQTAVGFMCKPNLFLLDEPFDGFDIVKEKDFSKVLLMETTERSFLLSSHRMNIVERLADCVIVLDHGRIKSTGNPSQVAKDLCPSCFSITIKQGSKEEIANMTKNLKKQMMDKTINAIGLQIIICGKDIKREILSKHLNENWIIEKTHPNLTDAMTHYLSQMS